MRVYSVRARLILVHRWRDGDIHVQASRHFLWLTRMCLKMCDSCLFCLVFLFLYEIFWGRIISELPDWNWMVCILIWFHLSQCYRIYFIISISVKVKAVLLLAWTGPEGSRKLRFPYFMTMAQVGGKFVSLMHRPPLPPENAPGTHFCYRLSRPQGHSATRRILYQWKIPMTPVGIEPATFWFVAQHLNHCATMFPLSVKV